MSIVYKCEQGSVEWWRLHIGKPTSSQFHRIVTPVKGDLSDQRRDYMYRLIAERLLKESMDDPLQTEWIDRGKELEPHAVAQFEFLQEVELEKVGFVTTNDDKLGCSPDRLVKGKAQAVEIKCPAHWTQIKYLLEGPGDKYKPQVQGQLLIGEFECVHFYAYSDRMPAQHLVTYRDEAYLKKLDAGLRQFLEELDRWTELARRLGTFVANPGFTTPHENVAPGPDPLQVILP